MPEEGRRNKIGVGRLSSLLSWRWPPRRAPPASLPSSPTLSLSFPRSTSPRVRLLKRPFFLGTGPLTASIGLRWPSAGSGQTDTSMFPEVDSTWKTFNKIQKLLSKTNGKVIGDVMTPSPLVVRETTNLEDVARLLLETKYHRLPVVDSAGKLIGIITRGNVVRAALQIKHASEKNSQL